ncbi:hypothetical protein [Streptomyces sp. NPDC006510]|uniref:hypothetical protein n=1 Tax=Streptomyces sp. NPDC006510 TaxID=3155600 RepID=UPI0033AA97CB
MPDGTRAYALLDGVGDNQTVRAWTRTAARRLARAAAGHADAEAGLRAEYDRYAADPARHLDHDLPTAAAVAAVHVPGGLFSVAWSGDARAYFLLDGHLRLLTEDHNKRRAYDGDRNLITACLEPRRRICAVLAAGPRPGRSGGVSAPRRRPVVPAPARAPATSQLYPRGSRCLREPPPARPCSARPPPHRKTPCHPQPRIRCRLHAPTSRTSITTRTVTTIGASSRFRPVHG